MSNNPFSAFDAIKIDLEAYNKYNEQERTEIYVHMHNHFLASAIFLSGRLRKDIHFWDAVEMAKEHFLEDENYEFLQLIKDFTTFCNEKNMPVRIKEK
jgi:hypothetical protein